MTTASASASERAETSPAVAPPATGGTLHVVVTCVSALAVAAWQFTLIDRGGFWMDDFVNLAAARKWGLSPTLMVMPVFQHFAPGHRVLDWLVAVPFHESYTAAVLIMVIFIAGAVIVTTLLLDECFGRRWVHILLAVAAGSSWTLTDTGGWWAAGAHSLPSIFWTQLALLFYVRWHRRRVAPDYYLALLWFAISLMFWELSLLFILEAGLLVMLLLGRHDRPRAAIESLIGAIPRLAPFIALGLAYVIYVSAQPWHQPFQAPPLAELRDYTKVFVLRGWIPPLIGTGTGFGPLTGFQRITQELAVALLAVGFVVAIVTRRAVIRALIWIAATLFTVWFAVAFYRLAAANVWVGDTGRLITPLPFLFWIGVAFALQPAEGPPLIPRGRPSIRLPRVRPHPAIVGAGLAAAIVLYALNLRHSDDVNPYNRNVGVVASARAQTIAAGVRVAQSRGLLSDFVESPIPGLVSFPGRWDDTMWRMAAYWNSHIDAIGSGTPLLTVDGNGVVRQNTFSAAPLASGSSPISCQATAQCSLRLIPRRPLGNVPAFVRIWITVSGPTRLHLTSDPRQGPQNPVNSAPLDPVDHLPVYDDTTRHLLLARGSHALVLALWATDVSAASITAIGSPTRIRAQLGVLVQGAPLA
jgi:hypothetical protein